MAVEDLSQAVAATEAEAAQEAQRDGLARIDGSRRAGRERAEAGIPVARLYSWKVDKKWRIDNKNRVTYVGNHGNHIGDNCV